MYRLILILIIFLVFAEVYASETVVTQTSYCNPQYGAYYGGDYIPRRIYTRNSHSRFSDINDLEKYAMNKNFAKDSDITRIERLEMLAFGAVQQGDADTRYNNVRSAILSRPKQNYKNSLMRTISNYFNGQITGYTPQIQKNYYQYGKNSVSNYSSPFGNGYRTENYGMGSGVGIHILN